MVDIISVVGSVLIVVGSLMVLIKAFQTSVLWGLAYIFIPFVSLIFVITHWPESKKGFLLSTLGFIVLVTAVNLKN